MPEPVTILLVEDDPDDVELNLRALRACNLAHTVRLVRDGAEALDYLLGRDGRPREGHSLPAAVLLDLHLPKVDGLEVLRRLRADRRTRLVPVIILTSSDEEKDRLRGYTLGCNSFVCKPIEYGEFMRAVQQLGLYWLVLNQPPPTDGGA